jgi:hypothetical protein
VWQVGGDRVDLAREPGGWVARVSRAVWCGKQLVVDGQFADEAEAVAWCERMAEALAADLRDGSGGEQES